MENDGTEDVYPYLSLISTSESHGSVPANGGVYVAFPPSVDSNFCY